MNKHDNAVFKTGWPKNQTGSTMYMKIRLDDFWATLYMQYGPVLHTHISFIADAI